MPSPRIPPSAARLWRAFLRAPAAPADAPDRLYGVIRVGDTSASAGAGARLILAGVKTATSSLASEYGPENPAPPAGSFSIVLDGRDRAACIVETVAIDQRPFHAVDETFARAYGEWDGSLATWRRECGAYYAARAARLDSAWSESTPLLCERIRVVFPVPGTDADP